MTMPDNNAIVTAFVREFDAPAVDAARIASYFTADAVYHNMPWAPITGAGEIGKTLASMAPRMTSKGWEIIHQVAAGDVVMNERVDRFDLSGKAAAIPVVGVFELKDGKIAAWRDYFDGQQAMAQMA
jgi:limonene-1,2-epoxide hydrolase